MNRLLSILMLIGLLSMTWAASTVSAASTTTVVVHPGDMNGWAIFSEGGAGSGALVNGPGTPPLGTGSLNLVTPSSADAHAAGAAMYTGTRFVDMTTLQYSTYRASGDDVHAISLQLNVDYDLTDDNTAWQGRLVFEPRFTETVVTGEWQTWNALTQGQWWATGAPGNTACSIGSRCTWDEVLDVFPNAGIHATLGAVILKAGASWAGFDGNADALTIGVSGDDTIYDFEYELPPIAPTYYQACLSAGSLSQVGFTGESTTTTVNCRRGTPVVLMAGDDLAAGTYYACLYAGTLSQVSLNEPASCGRGEQISLAAGTTLHACLFAGSLSQVGFNPPSNCGRGGPIILAAYTNSIVT